MQHLSKLFTLALSFCLITSCSSVAVGGKDDTGTYSYVTGELKSLEVADLATVYHAAIAALNNLELEIDSQNKDRLTGEITSHTSGEKGIKVSLSRKSDEITEVSVRVGTFGDQKISQVILEEIHEHLKP